MSIDLSVNGIGRLEKVPLLNVVRQELRRLLNLDEVPEITIARLERGNRLPLINEDFLADGMFLIGLASRESEVELLLIDHSAILGKTEPFRCASIAIRGSGGDPVKLALGAALAMGIATLVNRPIVDDGHEWVAQDEVTSEEMRRALTIHSRPKSLEDASMQMNRKMNVP